MSLLLDTECSTCERRFYWDMARMEWVHPFQIPACDGIAIVVTARREETPE